MESRHKPRPLGLGYLTLGSLSRACDTIECKEDSKSLKEKSVVPVGRGSAQPAPRSFPLFWGGEGKRKKTFEKPCHPLTKSLTVNARNGTMNKQSYELTNAWR